jgi:N-acyl-D-amino-acid deacylase
MENRPPDHDELQAMRDYVEKSMKQGARGLSTGLLYVPANYAQTEEVIELPTILILLLPWIVFFSRTIRFLFHHV